MASLSVPVSVDRGLTPGLEQVGNPASPSRHQTFVCSAFPLSLDMQRKIPTLLALGIWTVGDTGQFLLVSPITFYSCKASEQYYPIVA